MFFAFILQKQIPGLSLNLDFEFQYFFDFVFTREKSQLKKINVIDPENQDPDI